MTIGLVYPCRPEKFCAVCQVGISGGFLMSIEISAEDAEKALKGVNIPPRPAVLNEIKPKFRDTNSHRLADEEFWRV
jgi:hypothetical protein